MSLMTYQIQNQYQQQQVQANTQAMGTIMKFLTGENILNHMGWFVYIPTTIVVVMNTLNQHFNKEERTKEFVYLLIASILMLTISISYIVTFYINKEVNKYFNYVALAPIAGIVIAFFGLLIISRK